MHIASSGVLVRADTPAITARTDSKLVQLEALRGLAAFIVVAWHFLWAFDPARIGIVDGFDHSAAMLGSVSFASIDGPAAVTLFFVLSGFVLPLGFFRSEGVDHANEYLTPAAVVLIRSRPKFLESDSFYGKARGGATSLS